MNFILLAAGYPPISIPTDQRQDYYDALEAADSGNFPAFQEFLETELHKELDHYLEALEQPASSTMERSDMEAQTSPQDPASNH